MVHCGQFRQKALGKFVEIITPQPKKAIPMTYLPDFVTEVKNCFPRNKELHGWLDEGKSMEVGNFLLKEAEWKLTARQVADMIRNNRENEVRLEAERKDKIERLVTKWRQHREIQC